jgi:acetylornithine deacetylase/succinyl-diaminopimelate desuccinylase-like protein
MKSEQLSFPDEVVRAAAKYNELCPEIADLCVRIQQIPAPTGMEKERAAWVENYMRQLGLADVEQDSLYNVYGRIPGARSAPALLVSAHTDTVFPPDTDLTVKIDKETGLIFGPGIGDNSTGVASLLTLARTLMELPKPPVDIWIVANTGEEGLGDLRGMRAVVDRLQDHIGAVIVLEGLGLERIVHRGLGVRRYRIHAKAPGGHSWGDFGSGSAIHSLVKLAADIVKIPVPESPRTTYNIGRIAGGTSVNTIAQQAQLELDMRCEDPEILLWLIQQVDQIVANHRIAHEQLRDGVEIQVEEIGNRPAGQISRDHPLAQATATILRQLGATDLPDFRVSSTDANVPLSRGIPAVCIGMTEGGDAHRLSEWMNPEPLARGMQQLLYLAWWAASWLADER